MIVDNIKTLSMQAVPEMLAAAFNLLKTEDFAGKKAGAYHVDGDKLLYHVQEYETAEHDDVQAEIHKMYCDIHYMVSGCEVIGWAPYNENLSDALSYDEQNDIAVFSPPQNETLVHMEEGNLAFFAPYEIHRPRLALLPSKKVVVKKVVVKIRTGKFE